MEGYFISKKFNHIHFGRAQNFVAYNGIDAMLSKLF